MAIGSVEELVDYKEQTIAIAKKYGGEGTTVVANPEGTATAELTKLKVGENIYSIDNKPKSIVLCNSNDITTDAKGYISNTLNLPDMFAIHLTEVFFSGSMIPGGESMYPYYVVNGGTLAGKGSSNKHYPVLRLYSKTTGEPVANMAAGTISDMSILTAIYFNN